MKKLLTVAPSEPRIASSARASVLLATTLALGLGFWTGTTHVAQAREMTPLEMIESKLPEGKTLTTAAKPEVLSAVCAAVAEWKEAAPRIVKTAVEAQKTWSRDIVATAIRCLPGETDCNSIVAIATAAVAADPDEAANIVEMIISRYPDCRGTIERDFKGSPLPERDFKGSPLPESEGDELGDDIEDFPPNVNPPPGTPPGGFTPEENVTICDNGMNVQVPASRVDNYLATHPGSSRGACEPTPITNT